MTQPRVWAPAASQVELVAEGTGHAMRREGEWWIADVELAAGARYGFRVDGTDPMPDPRSRHQPDGVHGLSGVVPRGDAAPFSGPALPDSVFYELHVGTFSDAGTLAGAVEHLDYLVDLGVTTVELMPLAAFPGQRGWGYDGVDLYAPHQAYGGPEGVRAFVDACHHRGLAVFLDVVYNHLGPDGNYLPEYGPYFTDAFATPWGAAVNFANDEVRAFVIDNALLWLDDYGFDGLRLDAVHALHDSSPVHILDELAAKVAKLDAPKLLVAESETLNARLLDYGLSGQWFDAYHHALHALLTGERDGYYQEFGSLSRLIETLGEASVPPGQLVGFTQNHDQIGNRARGERLCHLVNEPRQRIAAALTLLGPFTPLMFMGEEWAASSPFRYFTDHEDPALATAVRDGRRREFASFGWNPEDVPDPQSTATFERSKLMWHELDATPHAAMRSFYRDLLALRRATAGVDVEVRATGSSRLEMHRGDIAVTIDLENDALDVAT